MRCRWTVLILIANLLWAPSPRALAGPTLGASAPPLEARQGGDFWETAVLIPQVPFLASGTNVGYTTNCCAEMCPYEALGPAVFYKLQPEEDLELRLDLCGSDFDTGLYVFDADRLLVACNIDAYFGPPCGMYVSCIEYLFLPAGETFYVVVTGMSGAAGNYILEITEFFQCEFTIPADASPEGEPPLVDGYSDQHNGGCNSLEFGAPFQDLLGDDQGHLDFAGIAGWYTVQNHPWRDTDWFTAVIGESGLLVASLQAELASSLLQLAPLDCEGVDVAQSVDVQDCQVSTLEIQGDPGELVWLWVGADSFGPPGWYTEIEYPYLLTLDGLQSGTVTTENLSWGGIRALYRTP